MNLDDSKAGKIGRCLQCNQKFRVPSDIDASAENSAPDKLAARPKRASSPPLLEPAPRAVTRREPPPPKNDADIMKLSRYDMDSNAAATEGKARPIEDFLDEAQWEDIEAIPLPSCTGQARQRKKSFIVLMVTISVLGATTLLGTIAFFLWTKGDTADASNEAPIPKVSVLRLQVEGKEVVIPIERMNCNHVKRGRDEFPDYFELEGRGVSVFGKFWIGFEEQWDELKQKPLTIVPQDPSLSHGESHIGLPDKGDLKVTNGKLVVKEVIQGPQGDDPFFRGEIELELKGKGARDTLNVKGTFEAQVHTWF